MMKVPWRKKKKQVKHIQQQVQKQRQSYFSDQVIQDFSVTACPCELYFPEPSVTFDEFGAIKDVCLSGDALTILWNKHCIVHLCEIQGVAPNFPFTLEDTGQECEICLSVVLNRSKSGDFSYQIRDKLWHEYSHKVGERWRRFVLKFDDEDEAKFNDFEKKLKEILQEVNRTEEINSNKVYLLVAVQTKLEKRKSSLSLNRHSKLSLLNLQQIEPDQPAVNETPPNTPQQIEDLCSSGGSFSEDEDKNSIHHTSLTPPFDPAPYIPDGDFFDDKESLKSASNDSGVLESINHLCDSLHIHPNELPQTLSSILRSATYYSDDTEEIHPGTLKHKSEFGSHLNQPSVKHRWHKGRQSVIQERLNSEFIPSEERYIPMGYAAVTAQKTDSRGEKEIESKEEKETIMANQSQQNQRLQKAQELAQLLQTSINNSDPIHAQEYANQLASQNVIVAVDVKLKTQSPAERDKEFNLKVTIEDKESSGGTITLKVRATDTIRDLKNRMLMKHMFPVEVQNWIIGKRIPQDNETLEKCRIKNHGFTAFLYLISAKAAGINKEEFMRRQNMLLNPAEFAMAQPPQTPTATPAVNQTPSRPGSTTTPGSGSGATGSASAGKLKMEPRILEENLNIVGKNEKYTPEKLQGQVQAKVPTPKLVKNEPNINRVRQTGGEIAQILQHITPQIGAVAAGYPETPYGESKQRIPVMHPEENEEPQQGWSCPACTYINQPTRPGCELCAHARPSDYEIPPDYVITEEEQKRLEMEALIERRTREAQQQEQQQNFANLQETDALDIIPNAEDFTCPICFEDIAVGNGVVLRECLHLFCKDCLRDAILYNEDPVLKCPFMEDYACDGIVQDREIKALVTPQGFAKYLARSLATAESQAQNSFHCKTADCPGWCIYEDHVNFFVCQVCGKENCLTCKAIHQGQNCKQYQEDLKLRAVNDKAASQTQLMIKKMLDDGDAMNCPQCQVIVMKKEGCDWIQCSICKTEICWVTKGPRWGPLGNGDISGGCQCRVDGQMCHPECNNCH